MDHTKIQKKIHEKTPSNHFLFFSDFSAKIDFYLNSHFFFSMDLLMPLKIPHFKLLRDILF